MARAMLQRQTCTWMRLMLLLDLLEEICGISFDSSRITIIARRISYYYDSMDKFCIFCQTAQISLNMMWYLDQPM
ncbi:hypothetical protein QL285_038739 [Trifolium repens]|nr:hypothetical protein QL285_038739 [Trifolium repens]